jgi:nitrate reductase molybdenum cofactor assembly chaperone NarJ/NarW
MGSDALLELMSQILTYPDAHYLKAVEECRGEFARIHPESTDDFDRFAASLDGRATEELQELYVRTFDLNPVCALEVGWQLFGDSYDRGEFLVTMRQELKRHGIPESSELSDHISHLLPLAGKMETQQAHDFASTCLLPAMKKMLAGLEGKGNPYENFLNATACAIEAMQACAEVERG